MLVLSPVWAWKECPPPPPKVRKADTAACRSKIKQQDNQTHPSGTMESTIFDSLYNTTDSTPQPAHNTDTIQLDHHLYHSQSERWIQKPSQPQPFLTLMATVHPDNYRAWGFQPVTSQPHIAKLTAMADTGCQSCLDGLKVIYRLGLCERNPLLCACMLPTTMGSRSSAL